MSFAQFPLAHPVLDAVTDAGYSTPTPIQSQAIPLIAKRRDVIGIAQTGTGKTAAFTLPILSGLGTRKRKNPGVRALIIAPTRELVTQICDNIATYSKHLDLSYIAIYGGVGEQPQIIALQSGVDIVVATPGRLIDLIDQGHFDARGLEYWVLDEADRMLDMGFLPAIRKITRKIPNDRQTLLFSATLSGQVEKLGREFLKKPALVEVSSRTDPAKTVNQTVYEVPRHLKLPLLLHFLEDQAFFTVLVFTSMKHHATVLAKKLTQAGIAAEAIHGDRTQNQRQRALDKFKAGKLRVLVGTDVAARGLDISGVTHVVNYDFPMQNEDYIHRIGRTGRAEAKGEALTFVEPNQHRGLHLLEKFIQREIPREHADGFDYDVPPPVRGDRPPRRNSPPQQQRDSPRQRGGQRNNRRQR